MMNDVDVSGINSMINRAEMAWKKVIREDNVVGAKNNIANDLNDRCELDISCYDMMKLGLDGRKNLLNKREERYNPNKQ